MHNSILSFVHLITFFIVIHFMMPETARACRIEIAQVVQPTRAGIVQIAQPAQPIQPT